MHSIFEKVLHVILNIVTVIGIFIVALVIYNHVQLQILNKNYTNFFGYTIFEISTGSMKDTLNVYDVVLVKITEEVNQNDIITYQYGDEMITHRIVEINDNEIVTKGDANNTEDKRITKEDIVGKVVFICPKAGIWMRVFSEPKILVSLCITLILIEKSITKESDSEKHRALTRRKRKEEKVE